MAATKPPGRDLRVFKFVVQAVLLEHEDGHPVAEHATEPVTLYGVDKLTAWAEGFEASIEPLRKVT